MGKTVYSSRWVENGWDKGVARLMDAEATEAVRILARFVQPQGGADDDDLLRVVLLNLVQRALIEADLEDEEGGSGLHN
jgi:hypothetical protein